MPYLGREGQFGIRERFQYLAGAGDTSVSGADANGITMTFSDGLYIDVFLNGVKLKAGEDYNTDTANTVAGISAMNANDEVEVIAYDAFSVADTVSAADGGTFSGNVAMSGTLSVTGATTVGGILKTDDTTEATSTTDGSLQTDGGLSVVKDAVFGDDVKLLSDSSVLSFGADSDVTITHNADTGVTLNSMDISGVSSINAGQIGGSRNYIYNGDTSLCQRATSVANIGNGDSGYHVQDRWRVAEQGSVGGEVTMSRATEVPNGFQYSMKLDCTTAESSLAADEQWRFEQRLEGQDLYAWKKGTADALPVTLSFWVNATKTGTNIVSFYDNDNTRHISKSYTVNSSNTWEYKTITLAGDTTGVFDRDNGVSLQILFYLAAGSNYTSGTLATSWAANNATNAAVGQVNNLDSTDNNFHITGIQLELGETASAFQQETYGENFLRCARYYLQRAASNAGLYGTSTGTGTGGFNYVHWQFPVPMRAAPTMTGHTGNQQQINVLSGGVYNSAGSYAVWGNGSTASAEL